MFVLITTFYHEQNRSRRNEFLKALTKNAEISIIQKVYVLCESGQEFLMNLNSKIEIVQQMNRPKFKNLISFANNISPNYYRIIANTDIYFDDTLYEARFLERRKVYCLTRWDLNSTGEIDFYPNFKSQDSWIFRDLLPENIGDYFIGVPGCDNRLAAEIEDNGFKLSNPSLSIRSIHLHNSEKRTYHKVLDRVSGNYAYCLPTYLKNYEQSLNTKRAYFLVRKKYYNALLNKSLDGVNVITFDRIKAFFYWNYFRLRLKLI